MMKNKEITNNNLEKGFTFSNYDKGVENPTLELEGEIDELEDQESKQSENNNV